MNPGVNHRESPNTFAETGIRTLKFGFQHSEHLQGRRGRAVNVAAHTPVVGTLWRHAAAVQDTTGGNQRAATGCHARAAHTPAAETFQRHTNPGRESVSLKGRLMIGTALGEVGRNKAGDLCPVLREASRVVLFAETKA